MPRDLLFEIGSEEIPAAELTRALAELPGRINKALEAARKGKHLHGPVADTSQ